MKFKITRNNENSFKRGLRGFFEYKDLGIKEATNGNFGANVIKAVDGKHANGEWHYHKLKDETFYVQSGIIIVRFSDEDDLENANSVVLKKGDNFHVYRGLRHQMEAVIDTELFEFSTQHFDSDSYRIKRGD